MILLERVVKPLQAFLSKVEQRSPEGSLLHRHLLTPFGPLITFPILLGAHGY